MMLVATGSSLRGFLRKIEIVESSVPPMRLVLMKLVARGTVMSIANRREKSGSTSGMGCLTPKKKRRMLGK